MPTARPPAHSRVTAPIRARWILILAVVAALAVGAALLARGGAARAKGSIGLFTSLPILWNEEADVAAILKSTDEPHWARAVLSARGEIAALDTLAAPGGAGPLARIDRLVVAQPRPLSPDENVALDAWVRKGGRLLLLADPALTAESHFAVGDPRRPQAVVLISPILRRWGLELQFDEAQAYFERTVDAGGIAVPVNLPGRFAVRRAAACAAQADGLVATCRIGKGRVTALADAAVLDRDDAGGARRAALSALLDRAFTN